MRLFDVVARNPAGEVTEWGHSPKENTGVRSTETCNKKKNTTQLRPNRHGAGLVVVVVVVVGRAEFGFLEKSLWL